MANNRIKVLITDDSSEYREYLQLIFEKTDYILQIATNGEQAISQYLSFQPDIHILDLNLPDMKGVEVIGYIRNTCKDSDSYIIALTSKDDVDTKAQALNLGANDFLLKPFAQEEIKARTNVAKRQIRLNTQLRDAYKRIAKEIDTIATLQNKLLPKQCTRLPHLFSIETIYRPSGRASGDYYDFFPINRHTLRVIIADVSGHGARAAFLMAMVRALVRTTESYYLDLPAMFRLVNKQLCDTIGDERDFVTIFAADIDTKNNILTYINAGQTPGIIANNNEQTDLLGPTSTVLGFFELDFIPKQYNISDWNGLFLFTDGYYEWEVAPNSQFGLENFLTLVSDMISKKKFTLELLEETLLQSAKVNPSFRDDRSAVWISWIQWHG
ncbi:MAG TPA: SpoIIE family protein phosphatase [Desulfohalobiaceae bacterium]|nr:SpoIIE family protein phosphatase [Desulfohalobiaceae bacterium]